ncbi:MAG: DUF4258 domain-containing protein [Phycisphaerales bacterium]|nr:DUF4258 domain-containing protein [Phycisphaerales bacterium]
MGLIFEVGIVAMGSFFQRIKQAVSADRYVIGVHAAQRLRERRVPQWQAVAGLADGVLIAERPRSKPNASVEVEQSLPDGTAVKAVWSWLPYDQAAKLVTVHFLDR